MKNFFYSNELALKIEEILDANLPATIKNISTGDFSILPMPDDQKFHEYFPAVIIHLKDVENTTANKALQIYQQEYSFEISYIYPYTFETFEDVPASARVNVQKVANIFMNNPRLEDFVMAKTNEEAGGQVLTSKVQMIHFDNAESEVFRNLEIPISVAVLEYVVAFRTYQKG